MRTKETIEIMEIKDMQCGWGGLNDVPIPARAGAKRESKFRGEMPPCTD
jgi:hypothetical protein